MNVSEALIEGFLLSIGLIIAIGPQNIFILKQGLLARHTFIAAITCTLCDFFLIILGSMGLGSMIVHIEWLREFAIWSGASFLIYFGLKSWISVFRGHLHVHIQANEVDDTTRKTVILTAMGFSLLNPHAILDTIVLIGGLSAKYDELYKRFLFASGAGIASGVWFFSLSYGAQSMRPLFQKRIAAMSFELLSGSLMFWISWGLIQSELIIPENDISEEVLSFVLLIGSLKPVVS